MGRTIEPVIKPLGYDWKIGIALITSFAAREVFIGTMATLYSVEGGKGANPQTLRERMASAKTDDGAKVYTLATGVSLMIFYAFAMQCMSTLAVVKRETRGWKWPIIQVIYMTGLAYVDEPDCLSAAEISESCRTLILIPPTANRPPPARVKPCIKTVQPCIIIKRVNPFFLMITALIIMQFISGMCLDVSPMENSQ